MSLEVSSEVVSRRRTRIRGTLFGALVGSAFAGSVTSASPGFAFLWLGVPVAAVLGCCLGPSAAADRPSTAIRMATGCAMVGALLTGMLLSASIVPYGTPAGIERIGTILALGVVYGVFGALIFGLPSLLVLWPVARVWVRLVRADARPNGEPAAADSLSDAVQGRTESVQTPPCGQMRRSAGTTAGFGNNCHPGAASI
jgi:hypothetical protein